MQSLNHFIHTALQKKSRLLSNYTRELYKIVPSNFTGQCSVCDISSFAITISAPSSAIANQLRYYRNDITEHFSLYLNRPITQISLRISPKVAVSKEKSTKNPCISPNAAKQIHSLAETVGNDSLKQSLQKLAKRQSSHDER